MERYHDIRRLRRERLPYLSVAWDESVAWPRRAACGAHAPIRQEGARPPRPGRRDLSAARDEAGEARATLPVHRDRRCDAHLGTQDLHPPYPEERDRLQGLRGREVPVRHQHGAHRSRSRVSGAIPLAPGRPGHRVRSHPTAKLPAQWQGRALTPKRQAGILSTAHVQRGRRSRGQTRGVGELLQLPPAAFRDQTPYEALRDKPSSNKPKVSLAT